jgi:YegS/Rv2252/BmrU family lipid kinase
MVEKVETNGGKGLLEAVSPRKRIAIIFNPVSGPLDSAKRRAALEALARAAGLDAALAETDRERGAELLARKAVTDGMERLLACGGDGTATEAADVLAGTGVALAVLPGGTGNLLALNLGIPSETGAAWRLALSGEPRAVDVGRANGHVFLIMAGMGLDAHMVHDADRELKERLGALAYVVATLRNLRRPSTRYAITIDGRRIFRRARTVLVANVGRITGGLELVPGADPEDGRLDVVILRAQGLRDLAVLALGALFGRPPTLRGASSDPLLEMHQGREIVVEAAQPQPVQLDGNEAGFTTRLRVCVEPGTLRLVCPRADGAGSRPVAPPAAALSRSAGIAWQLLAGACAATAVYFRARAARALGRRPGPLSHHPLLVGLTAGALTGFLQRRRASPRCLTDGLASIEPTEPPGDMPPSHDASPWSDRPTSGNGRASGPTGP